MYQLIHFGTSHLLIDLSLGNFEWLLPKLHREETSSLLLIGKLTMILRKQDQFYLFRAKVIFPFEVVCVISQEKNLDFLDNV